MKRHILGSILLIASILLGWIFFMLGTAWFVIYVFFGSVLIMPVFGSLDKKTKSDHKSIADTERRTSQ